MTARRAKDTAAKADATNADAKTDAVNEDSIESDDSVIAEDTDNEVESSREFVIRAAQDRRVKFVRLWFTDILGMLKSTAIVTDELEAAQRVPLEEGQAERPADRHEFQQHVQDERGRQQDDEKYDRKYRYRIL